ncbi:MAG TPA: lysophospholipid acyltransferase family protein, partial [Gammaproteobacteria bacterium]|nr:lysophospholipid acyltransferase family protein [Gammaproteobacteria bacterium]
MMTRHSIRSRLYAFYAWCAGGLFVLIAGIGIVLLPVLRWRRAAARRTARGLLRLAGMRLTVKGLENIPAGGCIIVANHASYLDGVVLTAALPPRFGFVIKREMTSVPLVSTLLHRLGSQFVERSDPSAIRADTGRLIRSAANGTALGIFPEGTFKREPGIGPFRLGAFRAACRGGVPLITCGIQGTRHILPSET